MDVQNRRFHIIGFILLLVLPFSLAAHNVNYSLEHAPGGEVWGFYFWQGLTHIIPYGLDHILFVVGLCLLSDRWKALLWQATAFTLAHSITLALSLSGTFDLPSAIVEPLIALSILFIAVENVWARRLHPWRIGLVFLFGLLHGLGFAGVLSEVGLPPGRFYSALVAFNLGVEAGQIIVIAIVFGILVRNWGSRSWYRRYILWPLSALIGLIALIWFLERLPG